LINQPDQEGWTKQFTALVLKWAIALQWNLHSRPFFYTDKDAESSISVSSHAVGLCVS